jgi:hypothetical protein
MPYCPFFSIHRKNAPLFLRIARRYQPIITTTNDKTRREREYERNCEYAKTITPIIIEVIRISSEPEYFSYNMVQITVANIKSEVKPKFEIRTESIIKLSKNTAIYMGIFFIKIAQRTPNKKTNGKFMSVVSTSTAAKDARIKNIMNL